MLEIDINSFSTVSEITNVTEHPKCNEFEHICNFAQGVSLKKKNSAAMKHLNKALKYINSEYKNIDQIPYEGFTGKYLLDFIFIF